MKNYLYIFLLVLMAVCSGCSHTHCVISINVRDTGEKSIKTKYHYQVTEKWTIDSTKKTVDIDKTESLANHQSEVFEQNGIPITIKKNIENIKNDSYSEGWTILLAAMTCGFFPIVASQHCHSEWSISVNGEDSIESILELCEHSGFSFSLCSPLGLLFLWGKKTCFEKCRLFDKDSFEIISTISYINSSLEDEALAYGIAVKIKELEDTGRINELVIAKAIADYNLSKAAKKQTTIEESRKRRAGFVSGKALGKQQNPFEILLLECEEGKDFAYWFVLGASGKARVSLSDYNTIRTAFRSSIKEHYLLEHPEINPRTLVVDFPEYLLDSGRIYGRGVVLTISVEAMSYDPLSRKGRLSIRINTNQFEEARQWVRNNIVDLAMEAKEKVRGDGFSLGTRFYSESETMKENGILEVEFITE